MPSVSSAPKIITTAPTTSTSVTSHIVAHVTTIGRPSVRPYIRFALRENDRTYPDADSSEISTETTRAIVLCDGVPTIDSTNANASSCNSAGTYERISSASSESGASSSRGMRRLKMEYDASNIGATDSSV